MKKILALFLFLFAFIAKSQNITLDELINLKKHNLAYVEEYLTKKGWRYMGSEEEKYYDVTMFAYSSSYNPYDFSVIFCNLIPYSDSTISVGIMTANRDKYTNYLDRIKSFGCKLIDSSTEKDALKKVYKGATTTFEVTIYNTPLYTIFIYSNEDYDR
jgi:hypothetical protein